MISRRSLLLAGLSASLSGCSVPRPKPEPSSLEPPDPGTGPAASPAASVTSPSAAPTLSRSSAIGPDVGDPGTGPAASPAASVTSRSAAPTSTSAPLTVRRPPPPGPLPGVGSWKTDDTGAQLADCDAHWYYTWGPDHAGIDTPGGCEFVPMIEDRSDLTDEALATAKANGTVLLGFNEPELSDHANMTVQQVLNAWPLLEKTGLRLGSPAVAGNADVVDSYFYRFMNGVKARGYRVDFIPVHWFLAPRLRDNFSIGRALDDLQRYLERVYARYGLPVWLTEFSLITWYPTYSYAQNPDIQAEFLYQAATMMRTLNFLERWAWFAMYPTSYAKATAMYDAHGTITPVGQQFRRVS